MLSDSQLLCGEIEKSAHRVSFQNEWVFLAIKSYKKQINRRYTKMVITENWDQGITNLAAFFKTHPLMRINFEIFN